MTHRILACALIAFTCRAAGDPVAARLAEQAHKAQDAGQIVRAYLLYAEAAARDPKNPTYRGDRDAVAPVANLLIKATVQSKPDISPDIKQAQEAPPNTEPPVEPADERAWEQAEKALHPYPPPQFSAKKYDFDLHGDAKSIIEQVSAAYGVRAICDPDLASVRNVRLELTQADFHTAMEAVTDVTNSFTFPVGRKDIFFAPDTEAKRNELEPTVLLTFPLPNALGQKDLIEAATAVRGVLSMRAIGWDSASRTVLVRDRATRARIARSLLEAVLLPKTQVSFDVQFITLDSAVSYQYGVSWQTMFQLLNFGRIAQFQSVLQSGVSGIFQAVGGATLFGIGLTDANLFATYSKSFSRVLYDATVLVGDGQTANLHIGDKYPIQTTVYSGASQSSSSSIYNPLGQVTMEDLGLVLKLTPRVNGKGEVSVDVEADVKSLGSQVYDTIPVIAEREYKGTVTMGENQAAVIAGLQQNNESASKNGLWGLGQIPGLSQIFSENTRNKRTEDLLLVIRPTLTSLPISAAVSPQYLLGPTRGERVLM